MGMGTPTSQSRIPFIASNLLVTGTNVADPLIVPF